MGNFAIVENGIVTNLIVSESKEVAEDITGKECVEYFSNNPAYIGLAYSNSVFEQPQVTEERILQFTPEEWESYINSPERENDAFPLFTNPTII